MSSVNLFYESRRTFNNKIKKSMKGVYFDQPISNQSFYKTEKDYQKSFDDLLKFEKQFTEKQKKQIDSVLYHAGNNDGIVAAYCFWQFITNNGKNKNKADIKIYGIQPDYSKNNKVSDNIQRVLKQNIEGKHVLILDLNYGKYTFDYVKSKAKSVIVIDNHPPTINMDKSYIFSSHNHAACASTFKFFFPKKEVPLWIQYSDADDIKMIDGKRLAGYLPQISLFTTFLNVRFTKSNMLMKTNGFNKMYGGGYEQLHAQFSDNDLSWMIVAGSYMNEIKENFNHQLAQNAREARFFGYNVTILNLEFQGVDKNVGRQMITNLKNRYKREGISKQVDFAVVWGYHHDQNQYKLTLINDHSSHALSMIDVVHKIKSNSKLHVIRAGGMKNVATLQIKGEPEFLVESLHKNVH